MRAVSKNSIKRKIKRYLKNCLIKKVPCGQLKVQKSIIFDPALVVENEYTFSKLSLTTRGLNLVGKDDSGKFFLKIELDQSQRKNNTLAEEAKIIKKLNNNNAVSSPKLFSHGTLNINIRDQLKSVLSCKILENPGYIIMEYLDSDNRVRLSDILLSILEQKALGVYQGDIKPENIRFKHQDGVCKFVDYDQAILLSDDLPSCGFIEFQTWMNEHQLEKYNQKNGWLRHFPKTNESDVSKLLVNGALDLSSTTLYIQQQTTNTENGVYQSLYTSELYAKGVRDIEERKPILDSITFRKNEKVVDIGCNIGLLTHYLEKKGCQSWGFELDPSVVKAASIIAHIIGSHTRYSLFDLDKNDFPDIYDTIMLFSVFHHTKNVRKNGKKIAAHFNRIIIECRLIESGRKPTYNGENWEKTSNWEYENISDLTKYLEDIFPLFKCYKVHGQVDKGRYILELRKLSY